ncbi:hypothetical protein DRW03_16315 [Corallococcus sp. H22C18031201]|uniref:CAP domain-containing protein n=1 Tax=Citreicoccus inhibens TaxID=2849499 RepID=UPI000E74DB90|nr:CAP domain-containing protein [Citreicoccus inhibens]MBU8896812.1 hypothetical protein [Citreicoccus inhibens]RJS21892.1 hypothetical protein DRW03_16315 [Corallococcus sp. H22C18031201]
MRHLPLRHLLSLGLLATSLLSGCDSDTTVDPPDDPPGAEGDAGTPPHADPQFVQDMLTAHNAVRAGATPQPTPALPALTWDTDAETTAAKWAVQCRFEHNANRGNYGENIAAATPDLWQTEDVVTNWASEAKDYTLATNKCADGKTCGHYTQIVWRNTARLGCASQKCTTNSPFGSKFPNWELWVCDYAPPGNYAGQRPY